MDNKQATPSDLGYLAAMYDGEGCIAIQQQRLNGKRFGYAVNVKITNSDMNIIEKCQSILLKLGVNPLIRERSNEDKPQWKAWFEVYLTKQSHIKMVLEAVLPYLAGKRARAIVMLRYIDKTIEREDGFEQLRVLNSKGKSSETTRETPQHGLDPNNFDDCSGSWNGIYVNHVFCDHSRKQCNVHPDYRIKFEDEDIVHPAVNIGG